MAGPSDSKRDSSRDLGPARSRRRLSPSATIQSIRAQRDVSTRASCDDRQRFDIDKFESYILKKSPSTASRRSHTRPVLQMIQSAFTHKNLRTAFLLKDAIASRSNVVSLDTEKITRFSRLLLMNIAVRPYILTHACDRALLFCQECIKAPKIRTNFECQALLTLNFHPAIGLPSSRMRITADAIATAIVQRVHRDQQRTILKWMVLLPKCILKRIVRAWVQHLSHSWLSQLSPSDTARNKRGPQYALHWVRMIYWACRVRERDVFDRPSGSYLVESDFYSAQISRQLNVKKFLEICYDSKEKGARPSTVFVNHPHIFDATVKSQLMLYEAKLKSVPAVRALDTNNAVVVHYISSMRRPSHLDLDIRRDSALQEAVSHLASVATAERIQMEDVRVSARQSITRRSIGITSDSRLNEAEIQQRVRAAQERISTLLDKELAKFKDMCFEAPLRIRFRGESGVDEGGLSRHFFELISDQACNSANPLFVQRNKSSTCLWFPGFKNMEEFKESSCQNGLDPHASSSLGSQCIQRYHWFGVLLGMAVKSKCRMSIQLPALLFEYLQHDHERSEGRYRPVHSDSVPNDLQDWVGLDEAYLRTRTKYSISNAAYEGDSDLIPPALRKAAQEIDPKLLKGVDTLLAYQNEAEVEDVFCLEHSVSLPTKLENGPSLNVSLVPFLNQDTKTKPAMRSTSPVNGQNRAAYARALIKFHIISAHQRRIEAIRQGFRRIAGNYFSVRMCSPKELQLSMCGDTRIHVYDIFQSARYAGGYDMSSPQIRWLFEILARYDAQSMRNFYLFVTGSSVSPCGGVSVSPITIQKNTADDARFPSAHTCFNQFLLPAYSTKIIMMNRLRFAVESCNDFGLI